jgi:hypothetical protein
MFSAAFRDTSATSTALRLSKSISDGVSILGKGELPIFRLSNAVEGVTELLSFEAAAESFSSLIEILLRGENLADPRFTCQWPRRDDHSATLVDSTVRVA